MTLHQRKNLRTWLLCPLALLAAGCSMLGLGTPTATLTPFPSPTPLPTDTPPPPTPDYLYQDSFTDPGSGWPTVSTDLTAGYHPPDAYHLEVRAPDTPFWVTRQQSFGDFSAELQVYTENASEAGEWRHGLLFRATANDRFYAFLINPRAQSWGVLKRTAPSTAAAGHLSQLALQAGEWQVLASGANASIVAEPKAINTLRVDAQGPNMTFSINGQSAAALADSEFASGDFGFVLETHDATLAHIHYDVLTVRAFDAAQVPPAPTAVPSPVETGTPTQTPVPTQASGGGQAPTADVLRTAAALATQAAQVTIPALPSLIPQIPTIPLPANQHLEGTPEPRSAR